MKIDNKVLLTQALEFALGKLPDQAGIKLTLEEYDESMAEQSYRRHCAADGMNVSFTAADEAGLMYGILDLAEALKLGLEITDCEKMPYLQKSWHQI